MLGHQNGIEESWNMNRRLLGTAQIDHWCCSIVSSEIAPLNCSSSFSLTVEYDGNNQTFHQDLSPISCRIVSEREN